MDGRNDKANRYGLQNRKHINRDGGLSINGQGSGNKEEDEEREDEGNCPNQRRRVDKADNEDAGEVMEVTRVIDFEAFALNPEEGEGSQEDNNGHRGTLPNNQGQGGGNSKQSRTRRRRLWMRRLWRRRSWRRRLWRRR